MPKPGLRRPLQQLLEDWSWYEPWHHEHRAHYIIPPVVGLAQVFVLA
jgi:hypothetical protein